MTEEILYDTVNAPIPWLNTIHAIILTLAMVSIVAAILKPVPNNCAILNSAGIITTVEHYEAGCP